MVARANNELHGITLERIGVDKVIHPESEGGGRLAHNLFNPNLQEYLEMGPNFGISRMRVPDTFIDKTLKELGFSSPRDKYGLVVLAIRRGRDITLHPDVEDRIKPNDILILAGKDDRLESLPY